MKNSKRRDALRIRLATWTSRLAALHAHLRTIPLLPTGTGSAFAAILSTVLTATWALPAAQALLSAARPAEKIEDGAIGLAVGYGIDAAVYTKHYVLTVAGAVLCWLALYVVFGRLEALLCRAGRWHLSRRTRIQIQRLALFALLCQVLELVRPWDRYSVNARLLLVLMLLTAGAGMLSNPWNRARLPERARSWADGFFSWRALPLVAFLLPLSWPFLWSITLGTTPRLHLAEWVSLTALGLVLCALLGRSVTDRPVASRRRFEARTLAALTPALYLPVALVAANELQYRFQTWSVHGLARLLCVFLVAVGVLLYMRTPRRSPRQWLYGVVFPSTILQLAVLRLHSHVKLDGNLDLFHRGEQVLPTQQWFHFGKIPFLDIRPVHGLSDMLFQSLYALLNGSEHGADGLVWSNWMPSVLNLLLCYWLLRPLLGALPSFLFVTLVPVTALLPSYYGMVAVVPIALYAVLRRPSAGRYAGLLAALLAAFAWRVDFGIASVPPLLGVLAVHWWLRREPGRELRWFLRAAAAAAAFLLLLVGVGAALATRPFSQSLSLFLHSYLVRGNTRARPNLFKGDFDIWVFLQYELLPAIAVVAVVYWAATSLLRARLPHPRASLVAYLAAFSLVLSTRGLERHTQAESFNPFLFALVLVLLPVLLRPRRRSVAVLAAVLALFALRMMATAPPMYGKTVRLSALQLLPQPGTALFEVQRFEPSQRRFVPTSPDFLPLLRFLNQNLGPQQTFYDFSESPLLYAFARREFPTYLIPALEHTGTRPQRAALQDLESLRSQDRLPIVIFRRGTTNDFGGNGGPAEVRIPGITEWIYRNYEPLALVGRYDVWAERGAQVALEEEPVYPLLFRRQPNLLRVRELKWAEDQPFLFEAIGEDPQITRVFRWAEAPPATDHPSWALRLRLASSVAGSFQFFWRAGDDEWSLEQSEAVPVEASGNATSADELKWLDVTFRIDRWLDGKELSSVRIDPPTGAKFVIESASLVGIETFSGFEDVPQMHDLILLPWALANVDARFDLNDYQAFGPPVAGSEMLTEDEPILLCRPEGISPWDANALLIRGRWDGRLTRGLWVSGNDPRPAHLRPSSRGRIYGTWDVDDRCCGFAFDLYSVDEVRGDGVLSYLVPLSSLWRWVYADQSILLQTNIDFELHSVEYVHADFWPDDLPSDPPPE